MNTKTCKHCGWVYPITQPGKRCRMCGEPFEIVVCSRCGKPTPIEDIPQDKGMCRSCINALHQEVISRSNAFYSQVFDDWIAAIASIPKTYPTLTERQWLDACTYFDGCAKCGNKAIDTRGFFIGAELGGRYCDWNIIPLCERCAGSWDIKANVLMATVTRDHKEHSRDYRKRLAKILTYLGGKLDAASGSSSEHEESTGDS